MTAYKSLCARVNSVLVEDPKFKQVLDHIRKGVYRSKMPYDPSSPSLRPVASSMKQQANIVGHKITTHLPSC